MQHDDYYYLEMKYGVIWLCNKADVARWVNSFLLFDMVTL